MALFFILAWVANIAALAVADWIFSGVSIDGWWPLLLGTMGVGLAGMSLVFARERGIQSRFAWGFAIAGLGWLIGMMLAVQGHRPLSP